MTASNREAAISKTLTYEGGYTNHPNDPGGPTNWGITIKDAQMYWRPLATAADVRAMPKSVAIDIYRQKYWAKMDCDNRPAGVDFVDFDLGVNSGTGRTAQFRKRLDPLKLSPVEYVKKQCGMRSSFLQGLKTWSVFGKGWGRRVADVEATGVRMALGASGQPVAPALKKQAAKAAKKSVAHSTGAASAGATVPALDQFGLSTAGLIFIGVIAVAVIGYFVWNAVQNHHRTEAYKAAAT